MPAADRRQKDFAMWTRSRSGRELLISSNKGKEDMDVAAGWSWYGPGAKEVPQRKLADKERR